MITGALWKEGCGRQPFIANGGVIFEGMLPKGLNKKSRAQDEGTADNTRRNGRGRSALIRPSRSWTGGPLGPVLPLWFS
jgi:hypothetical protein